MTPPFLLVATLLASVAAAAGRPTVAVVGLHDPELELDDQRALAVDLARIIDEDGRFDGLEPDEVARALVGREPIILQEAFLGPGRRLLDDGRTLYDQAQPDAALPVLEEAWTSLRAGVEATNEVTDLWEAATALGTTYLSSGDAVAAREAYSRAVALNPARTPSAARYPPDVVAFYEQVRRDLVTRGGTLEVIADAPEVAVWVNGVERGLAPLTVGDVVAGESHVVGRAPDGATAYAAVVLGETGHSLVELHLEPPQLGVAVTSRYGRIRQTAGLYQAIGRHASADLVLLAGVVDEVVFLQLYSPRTDAFSTPLDTVVEGTPAQAVAQALPTLLRFGNPDGTLPAPLTVPNPIPLDIGSNDLVATMLLDPREPTETRIVEVTRNRWYVLGAAGIGAAGIATAAAILATRGEPEPTYQDTITVGPVD